MDNRHIKEICDTLECVFYGTIKDVIICVPPRSLKTELVCIYRPTRCMGHYGRWKTMAVSVSDELITNSSKEARELYESDAYMAVFPTRSGIKKDMDQK